MGFWLVLIVLPLAAYSFRKGVVFLIPLVFFASLAPGTGFESRVVAQERTSGDLDSPTEASTDSEPSFWTGLWKTKNQQAADMFAKGQYQNAANTFTNSEWSAIAHHRAGNHQQAVAGLENAIDITSMYNRATALAFTGDLETALQVYENVLARDENHTDAAHNKAVLEKLLQQQQGQPDQQDSGENGEQGEDSQQDKPQQSQGGKSQEQESDQQTSPEQAQQPQSEQQPGSEQQAEQEQSNQSQQEQQEQRQGDQDAKEQGTEEQTAKETQGEPQQEPQLDSELGSRAELSEGENPLKDSSEQWLRTITDDPSGLLRRKFEYQSQQMRQGRKTSNSAAPKTAARDERY